jgi:serine/threonine protein phosphatase 1
MGFGAIIQRLRQKPSVPPGRIYAIGDIHGRFDLLSQLIGMIEADVAARPVLVPTIVILGDFIDRGPGVRPLIDLLMALREERNVIVLQGNHEATLLAALDGDYAALEGWLAHGGWSTLAAFGIDRAEHGDAQPRELVARAVQAIPADIRAWMAGLPRSFQTDTHFFVHAGVRPGTPLGRQQVEDMLWIREEFTESDNDHGRIVVHGHSVYDEVCVRTNRIGVDTGAWRTGILSAAIIDRDGVGTLSTREVAVTKSS